MWIVKLAFGRPYTFVVIANRWTWQHGNNSVGKAQRQTAGTRLSNGS
jgi:hypothetical protein